VVKISSYLILVVRSGEQQAPNFCTQRGADTSFSVAKRRKYVFFKVVKRSRQLIFCQTEEKAPHFMDCSEEEQHLLGYKKRGAGPSLVRIKSSRKINLCLKRSKFKKYERSSGAERIQHGSVLHEVCAVHTV
jgi:hypothetical protein